MKRPLEWMAFCGLAVVGLAAAGCGGGEEQVLRGDRGKADAVAGSCLQDESERDCFCDHDCYAYGDCCSDKIATTGLDLVFETYNAGLVDAVGMVEQRRGPQLEALASQPADVLCLQEVWSDDDARQITDELAETYPYSFRQLTSDDETTAFSCSPIQLLDLVSLNSCVSNECSDVSLFECIANQCEEEYDALPQKCQLCLSANAESPSKCAYWGAKKFANDGRNGLVLLSRIPLEDARYTEFDTHLIKRGVITARARDFQVQCTHMTPDLGKVPYPDEGRHGSWEGEHMAQIELMAEEAGDACTIMLGDLNTGPASEGVEGEMAENFEAVASVGGYQSADWPDAPCTHCADNPMVGGEHSSRIDHVTARGCDDLDFDLIYQRTHDGAIDITHEGRQLESRLSDHYGVAGIVSFAVEGELEP